MPQQVDLSEQRHARGLDTERPAPHRDGREPSGPERLDFVRNEATLGADGEDDAIVFAEVD